MCVCESGFCASTCVCLFTVPPLAQAGAAGVWNNKHKRDFTPLQSWKDMCVFFVFFFLSDNSVHFHPRQTLFTSNYQQFPNPTPCTIKLHHYIWVPTGIACPGLLMLYTPDLFYRRYQWRTVHQKTNSPVSFFFFWGGGGEGADTLTENQCSVSHEQLISRTLVHCWKHGPRLFVCRVDQVKRMRDTFRADKVSGRWGVNTQVTLMV